MLVLAGATFFGVNASVSKVVLDAGIEPARLTALRCTGAALGLLLLLTTVRRTSLRVPRQEIPQLIVLGLSGAALLQWLYFVALDHLPVGIALLLEFTAPLMVAVFSKVVLRHDVPRLVWLALALALGGLALVAQVWRDVGLEAIGVAAGLTAAALLATFHLLGKHMLERRDPLVLSFWMFAVSSVFWAVAQPWWNFSPGVLDESTSMLGRLDQFSVPVWLGVLWVIVFGTLAPYGLEVAGLRHLPATTTGIVSMVEPVVAAAVAWLWLEEVLNGVQLLGGLFVLTGVGLVQVARAAPTETDPEPPLVGEATAVQ
ncbi:MAG TPA: DMT family transporter [Acidimicrobiales bacterium]|nr:DMT family transporter [Acidimicrobiales bacterium]